MATTKDVVAPLTETGAAVVQGPFGVDAVATAGAEMPPPIAVGPVVEEPVRSAWRESGTKTAEKTEEKAEKEDNGKAKKKAEKAEAEK